MRNLGALSRRVDKLMGTVAEQAKANEDAMALDLITASLIEDLANIDEDGSLSSAPILHSYTLEQRAIIDRFCQRYNAAGAKEALLQKLAWNEEEVYEQS